MSSYDLLVYLEFMDDDGAFKRALRNGEYSENQITWRHIANELARLRATMHAVHGGQRYTPPLLKSRAEQLAEREADEATTQRREEFYDFATIDVPLAPDAQAPLDPDELWDGSDLDERVTA